MIPTLDEVKKLGRLKQDLYFYRDDNEPRAWALTYTDDNGQLQSIDWQNTFERIIISLKASPRDSAAALTLDSDAGELNFFSEDIGGVTHYYMEAPLTWDKTRALGKSKYHYDIETHLDAGGGEIFKWSPVYGEIEVLQDISRV